MFLNMLLPNVSITFSDIFTVEKKKILINKEGNSAAVITKKEKKL